MRILDKYDAKEDKQNVYRLDKKCKETYVDPSFQRYGGVDRGSGWTHKDSRSYIENFLIGAVYNRVIVADAEECLKFAKEQHDQESIEYFQSALDRGYKYISIDGNNTSSTLSHFIFNHEEMYVICDNGKAHFKDFAEEKQEDIKYTEKIDFTILRRISKPEICHLFRALNTQTKLNDQEYRQAMPSKLSEFIRNLANDTNQIIFTNFVLKQHSYLDKRVHEEITASLALRLQLPRAVLKKRQLDSLYETSLDLKPTTKKTMENIFHVMRDIAESVGGLKSQKLSKGQFHLFFGTCKFLIEGLDTKITDHEMFFNYFLEKCAQADDVAKNVMQQNLEEESFTYWLVQYANPTMFDKAILLFEETLMSDFDSLVRRGMLEKIRTEKDRFSFNDKKNLLQLQRGKDRNGEELKTLDLYRGLLEADHVKSIKDGGLTILENGELMTMEDNRKKGATSHEPYFDHQKNDESRA